MMKSATGIAVAAVLAACSPQEPPQPAPASGEPLPLPAAPAAVASASAAPAPAATDTVLPDGLEIHDLRVGTGEELRAGETAVVHYVGKLVDGTEFDSSRRRNRPFTSRIPGRLIPGWNEGLLGMRVGGLRKLVIPPSLGYGDRGAGKIPAGATLIFEIELLAVRP
jgi:FKBP-type peptidyl-prolyl cis-trans isomerase